MQGPAGDPRWGDVVSYGLGVYETIEEPELQVPHRGVMRAFNLTGLADLDSKLYIPGRGVVGELLVEDGGIRIFGEAETLC